MRMLGRGGVLTGDEGTPDIELARCECVTERELVWREEGALGTAERAGAAWLMNPDE